MTNVVSNRKRTANKQNARKSTGPKTTEGKDRAARNALKHGLLARSVVIDTDAAPENREEFDALLADFVADLKPTSVVEETLVERIATCYWRLRRAQRFEAGAVRAATEPDIESAVTLDTLKRKIKIAQRNLDHLVELQTVLEKPGATLSPEESHYLNSELPDFLRENEIYLGIAGLSGASSEARVLHVLWHAIRRQKNDLAELREQHESAVSQAGHRRDRAHLAVLPIDDSFIRVIRYETMLDRQFHRALSELRKLRRDHNRAGEPRTSVRADDCPEIAPSSARKEAHFPPPTCDPSPIDVPRVSPASFQPRASLSPIQSAHAPSGFLAVLSLPTSRFSRPSPSKRLHDSVRHASPFLDTSSPGDRLARSIRERSMHSADT